ncbi:MAG: VOC family protein [Chloroflexota bacterium]
MRPAFPSLTSMLGRAAVIAFAATARPANAMCFYRDILGLRFVADEEYALVFDAAGTMLRLAKLEAVNPAPHTVLGWQVADVDEVVRGLALRGVVFEQYPWMRQDELGIWTAPGGARVAWFKDPDGNLLSVTQTQQRSA